MNDTSKISAKIKALEERVAELERDLSLQKARNIGLQAKLDDLPTLVRAEL